jgi:hypothetical protein
MRYAIVLALIGCSSDFTFELRVATPGHPVEVIVDSERQPAVVEDEIQQVIVTRSFDTYADAQANGALTLEALLDARILGVFTIVPGECLREDADWDSETQFFNVGIVEGVLALRTWKFECVDGDRRLIGIE